MDVLKITSENSVSPYSLVSSISANKHSFFNPKIKKSLVKSLSFNKMHIFQPPSIKNNLNL